MTAERRVTSQQILSLASREVKQTQMLEGPESTTGSNGACQRAISVPTVPLDQRRGGLVQVKKQDETSQAQTPTKEDVRIAE